MPDLADLFPGFSSHWIDTSAGKIFARAGGKGPPLLALHGYPQTHVMWHRVAPQLAEKFTLVWPTCPATAGLRCPTPTRITRLTPSARWRNVDDRCHGSTRPRALPSRRPRSRRARLLSPCARSSRPRREARHARHHPDLGHVGRRWTRGCRCAHGTGRSWRSRLPLPELLLENSANEYFDLLTAAWKRGRKKRSTTARIAHYRASFTDPLRIHAGCEDYRAGQSTDVAHRRCRPQGRQEDHLPDAGALGHDRPAEPEHAARSLARMGHRRAWLRDRVRTFPARGKSAGATSEGAAGIFRKAEARHKKQMPGARPGIRKKQNSVGSGRDFAGQAATLRLRR